jgi:hypothetical protein
MKDLLHILILVLLLSVLFVAGWRAINRASVDGPGMTMGVMEVEGPNRADLGPQGPVGPTTGHGRIFGIDWLYVVSSGLVLVALGLGLLIGSGRRRHMLGQ